MKSGTISTFAGTGDKGATPDEAPLEGTPLNGPRSIDSDPAGNIYLVLREGNAVFRIDPRARRLARIAGTGQTGFTGDGGPALTATFNGPKGVAYASDQSLYIVDTENHAIRRVDLRSGDDHDRPRHRPARQRSGRRSDEVRASPGRTRSCCTAAAVCQRQRESLHSGRQ